MSRRVALGAVGILILLAGAVFALQGAALIGGSSFMNGSPTWIYAGGLIAIIGALIAITGAATKAATAGASPGESA